MITNFLNAKTLLNHAEKEALYQKLLFQLIKDFKLASIDIDIEEHSTPEELTRLLHEKVYYLIMEKFPEYLNLLYIVDVSEKSVKGLKETDVIDVSRAITLLILKREWQKVWFRNRL